MAESPEGSGPSRCTRGLVAGGFGVALGAVALTVYAYATRTPLGGRSEDALGLAGPFFGWFLFLAVLATAVLVWGGLDALTGRYARWFAPVLLAATLAFAAFAYLNPWADQVAGRLSGPGERPAVALAQVAAPLLTLAAALLVIAIVSAPPRGWSIGRAAKALISPFTAIGLVVSLLIGTAVAAWWDRGVVSVATVEPIVAAPYPDAVGTEVAYSVPVAEPEDVVPAGPGFVIRDEAGGVTAYDGVTGARRWNVSAGVFPDGCVLDNVQSTGTASDAVVIAECRRFSATGTGSGEPRLLGVDATTGELLWFTDRNLALAIGAGRSAEVVPVVGADEIGSLEPRTGALRWTRSTDSVPCGRSSELVADDLIVAPCGRSTTVTVLDGITGDERTIALPLRIPGDPTRLRVSPLAADSGVLILGTKIDGGPLRDDEYSTWAVDIDSGAVTSVPSVRDLPYPPWPGPVVQLTTEGRPGRVYTEVYSLPQRRLIRFDGLYVYSPAETALWWALIGDTLVTAAASDGGGVSMAIGEADGTVVRRPTPCPTSTDGAGVLPVPGATLFVCPPADDPTEGWTILGVR